MFIDTISEDGYFFQIKPGKNFNPEFSDTPVLFMPFFIVKSEVEKTSIDTLFARAVHPGADTVKYVSYNPKLPDSMRKKYNMTENYSYLLNKCININVKYKKFYSIKTSDKSRKKWVIGFCYARIKWLHFRLIDRMAFDYFNEPCSLQDPYTKAHFFDIYVPLVLCQLNEETKLSKSRMLEN